ncbi:MAG: ribokinase [Planctomycetota bacterium]|nr:MAG: ribokinase [Planctomycetota bacterium]
MGKRIVVVGSSNTDMIIKVPHVPVPGETIIGGTFSTAAGGKGANQAVAAARAGGDVTFIGRVGEDMFGRKAKDGFVKDGINVDYVLSDKDAPSGVALIFVGEDGENSIAVASGANASLSPSDVESAADAIFSADILIMQLETPLETIQKAAAIASDKGVKVILNPAPACQLSDDILSHVAILTPNESEAELLTGIKVKSEKDAGAAADALIAKGIETVIVTMGAKGAFIVTADSKELVAGFTVKAVDATAAGDVFNGTLAVAMAEGKSLKEAVKFANAAAALSVTKLGAQPSAPTRQEIEKFLGS